MNHPIIRLLTLAAFAMLPAVGGAATIVVDTLDDRSDRQICSLRSALNAATIDRPVDACRAGEPGGDQIVFSPALKGRLDLRSMLNIESSVRIDAPAPGRITVGGATVGIITDGTAEIRISGFEFRTGVFVRSVAALTLDQVRFIDNAPQMSRASALQLHGPDVGRVTISDSQFYNNRGQWAPIVVGGESGTIELNVFSSRFSGNEGARAGAVYIESGRPMLANLIDSDFFNNQGSGFESGGAVTVLGAVNLALEGSAFVRNRGQAAGAASISFASGLDVRHSVFERNEASRASALLVEQLAPLLDPPAISFTTFVDNGLELAAPALVSINGAVIGLRANLMRGGGAAGVCGLGQFRSAGDNLELFADSCRLDSAGDQSFGFAELVRVQLPGRYPAPTTDPGAFDSAIDRLLPGDCDDANGRRVDRDLAGRPRPRDYSSALPYGRCDAGAVELGIGDPFFPMP